jgi:hypothetical protein
MDPSQAALAPRAAHARAPACGAESFVGSDPPVRAAEVADHVFDEIAAAGELRPAALGRLLALYKANTLESALSLVVLCSALLSPQSPARLLCLGTVRQLQQLGAQSVPLPPLWGPARPSGAHRRSPQDKKMVQKLVVASSRSLYLVESSSDEPYGKHSVCASPRVASLAA